MFSEPFRTIPWNGWGHRVYAFVYARITRTWLDEDMPLAERGLISLLAFHTLRLGKMMAAELGREYLHHSSCAVLTRTAAPIALHFASWPSHWPRFRPKSSMEWTPMETSFAFKRQSHPYRQLRRQRVRHSDGQTRRSLARPPRERCIQESSTKM